MIRRRFTKNPRIVYVLCVGISLLILYHYYYSTIGLFEKDDVILMTKEEQTRILLQPLCVDVESETEPTILLEPMGVHLEVNYSDTNSLINFCKPYVYTKIFLRLGVQNTGDCDPLSTKRGTNCEWYHMCVWPISEDQQISKFIQLGQIWEESLYNFFLINIKDKQKGFVIDAGANIGQFTMAAAMLGHQVISFEPIPQHVDMIKRSLALNGASDRVFLFRNGLADYFSKTYINIHKDNKGGSTIESIGTTVDETLTDSRFIPGSRVLIHLVTLDSVFPLVINKFPDYKIHFWKADIEGYETRMFRGAWKFMSRYQPVIMFEVLGKSFTRTKCNLSKLFYALLDLNYTIERSGYALLERKQVDEVANWLVTEKKNSEVFLRPLSIKQ